MYGIHQMLETQNRTHAQNRCANPDYQRHDYHEFARRPCLAARYGEASPQWPGESQAAGRQEVHREVRQIADHQRVRDSASQAPPAEQQTTGDRGQDRVRESGGFNPRCPIMVASGSEISRARRPTQECG